MLDWRGGGTEGLGLRRLRGGMRCTAPKRYTALTLMFLQNVHFTKEQDSVLARHEFIYLMDRHYFPAGFLNSFLIYK